MLHNRRTKRIIQMYEPIMRFFFSPGRIRMEKKKYIWSRLNWVRNHPKNQFIFVTSTNRIQNKSIHFTSIILNSYLDILIYYVDWKLFKTFCIISVYFFFSNKSSIFVVSTQEDEKKREFAHDKWIFFFVQKWYVQAVTILCWILAIDVVERTLTGLTVSLNLYTLCEIR